MAQGRSLVDNLKFAVAGTPGTWAAAAVVGPYVEFASVGRRAVLVPTCGELDANMLVEIMEATSAAGAGAQELTGVTTGKTFTNGTDEGKYGLIELLDSDLSDGYTHIAVRCTPGNTDQFGAIWVIGDLYEAPADSTDAAFVVEPG